MNENKTNTNLHSVGGKRPDTLLNKRKQKHAN